MNRPIAFILTAILVIQPIFTFTADAPEADAEPLSEAPDATITPDPLPDDLRSPSLDDARDLMAQRPRAFTENRGQVADHVKFYEQGGSLWFTDDGVWFDIREE